MIQKRQRIEVGDRVVLVDMATGTVAPEVFAQPASSRPRVVDVDWTNCQALLDDGARLPTWQLARIVDGSRGPEAR